MKTWMTLASLATIAGCATSPPGPVPSIAGVWELKPVPGNSYGLDSKCQSTVQYRDDGTFVTRNGAMEIIGHYNLANENGALYYHEWDMRGNGGKSCQGLTSEFVIAHTKPTRRVVLEGDTLNVYSLSSNVHFVFERRSER